MHCFACDIQLDSPPIDRPTGRYYCSTCMEPTVELQLAAQSKEAGFDVSRKDQYMSVHGSYLPIIDIPEIEIETVEDLIFVDDDDYEDDLKDF